MQGLALSLLPVMLFLGFASLFTENLHPFELPDLSMGFVWYFEIGYLLWITASLWLF